MPHPSAATALVLLLALSLLCSFSSASVQKTEEVASSVDVISTLLQKAIHETSLPSNYFNSSTAAGSLVTTPAAVDWCRELTEMSLARLNQALAAVQKSPEDAKADIQTWLSAAITFHETCKDEAEAYGLSDPHMAKLYEKMGYLSQLVSNALAVVNTNIPGIFTGNGTSASRRAHDDGFPGWVSSANRRLLQATGVSANAVVAKDGSGNFKTVTEALNAATGGRFVIYVKAGVYNEKIKIKKNGITLIGDGKYNTIITSGSSVGGGTSLRGSATFMIIGDGFIAKDIGFQNVAGPENHQAIALAVISDRSVIYRCSISGYQDTLYAHSLRQFYRECDIQGTVDFIFGNAAAVFQSCNLVLRRPRSGGAYNTILAHGRSDPGQNTGFSVQGSKIVVGSDFAPLKNRYNSYLGRPWKAYSRSVVMTTDIDGAIARKGWVEWQGASSSTYRTLYYAEYANTGAGASTAGRVTWPGYHVLGMGDASRFTVSAFIGGNSWLPSTGVDFAPGL